MKVLVVGNGAREHAIVKKIAEEEVEIYAAMGKLNPDIAALSKEYEVIDLVKLDNYAKYEDMDIAFIGPESPLAAGVTDYLMDMNVPTVGPVKTSAKLEWSKAYAREVLDQNNITGNPEYRICRNLEEVKEFLDEHPDVAVKPDVLTGGKGVKVTGQHLITRKQVEEYARERIKSDGLVVLEEKLIGREFTLQAFSDGERLKFMPLVRDFKRAYDNDEGPNTGSMGSFSCADHDMPDLAEESVGKGKKIMKDTIKAMKSMGTPYKGVLYGGFMVTPEDTYLLEYNCRFGDPEAINVLSLLEKPLTEVGHGIIEGKLPNFGFEKKATVCVYLVPEGYPTSPVKDQPIEIGDGIESGLYYASVYEDNGVIKTTTSRSIALLGKGDSVPEARKNVYKDVDKITGRLHYRTDIAQDIQ
ncbi:phosphoribosylamine--glycine ligase [Candidatus Bathyarchaeota archaeon]|nr:phosphoribosylamine--glycine ligase [Candidatus Bathyarchaeota archaeon]